ncbi:hypothetical protein Sjap_026534 [Stephania japonica]|uniref:Uncharacterized protein n=1 Tax=Stephania japonica TaxID=461633 RepID=A0AAP0EBM3_9MAGN
MVLGLQDLSLAMLAINLGSSTTTFGSLSMSRYCFAALALPPWPPPRPSLFLAFSRDLIIFIDYRFPSFPFRETPALVVPGPVEKKANGSVSINLLTIKWLYHFVGVLLENHPIASIFSSMFRRPVQPLQSTNEDVKLVGFLVILDHIILDIVQLSWLCNDHLEDTPILVINLLGSSLQGDYGVAINFVRSDDIRILRDIEQYYSTQIDEMPMNVADLI